MNQLTNYFNNCKISLEICSYTQCNSGWRDKNVTSHRNCIYYIEAGEGEIIINNVSYLPKAGDIVVIPYGALVTYHPISDDCYLKYWCHFQAVCNSSNLFDFFSVPVVTHAKNPERITSLFRSILNCDRTLAYSGLVSNALTSELLAACLDEIGEENISHNSLVPWEKINLIDTYIKDNLDKKITLEQLAELLHFHPNYFIRFFEKYFGTSPLKYVAHLRIECAKDMLTTTNLPIQEIAFKLGYNSVFHFSNAFKSAYGYAPTKYRQLQQ